MIKCPLMTILLGHQRSEPLRKCKVSSRMNIFGICQVWGDRFLSTFAGIGGKSSNRWRLGWGKFSRDLLSTKALHGNCNMGSHDLALGFSACWLANLIWGIILSLRKDLIQELAAFCRHKLELMTQLGHRPEIYAAFPFLAREAQRWQSSRLYSGAYCRWGG